MRINEGTGRIPVSRQQGKRQARPKSETGKPADRVELSSSGSAAADRSKKLKDVKKNIQDGVYTRPSLAKAVADRLVDRGALDGATASPNETGQAASDSSGVSPEVRVDRVAEARRKIDSGEYSDEKIIDDIASKIMESFGFNTDN